MNLTTDPWIPAVSQNGESVLYSLQDLFSQAHELRDLATKPHERIALMRLLLCITQVALDGPEDEAEWEECRDLIQPRVKDYLEKWKSEFELFLGKFPFLQFQNLKTDKKNADRTSSTKIDFALASANNPTLFDNAGGEERKVQAARLALNLLTFQCFTPSEIVGAGELDGITIPKTTRPQGPCSASSIVHAFLVGRNILETIWLNLFDKETVLDNYGESGWGMPIWEKALNFQDETCVTNATLTYLGRLVPISRSIRLDIDCQYLSLTGSLFKYPLLDNPKKPSIVVFREPHSALVPNEKGPSFLRGDVSKSLWRQLGAVIVKKSSDKTGPEGPIAISRRPRDRSLTVWMGSFISSSKGIVDVIEGVYPISKKLLSDWGYEFYEKGLLEANQQAQYLADAYSRYLLALTRQGQNEGKFIIAFGRLKEPDKEQLRKQLERVKMTYWTYLESCNRILLKGSTDADLETWGEAIRVAANDAYQQACPRQTAPQIQAYSFGLEYLRTKSQSKTAKI